MTSGKTKRTLRKRLKSKPVISHVAGATNGNKVTMILSVFISHNKVKNKEVLIYAMLDTQADDTYVTEDTCTKLGIDGVDSYTVVNTICRKGHTFMA